jgi:hypothetical protein
VKSILANTLDRRATTNRAPDGPAVSHANIRGPHYYHRTGCALAPKPAGGRASGEFCGLTPREKDMLNHPTLDQLNQLGLFGGANVYRERQALTIAKAFAEILASGDASTLTLAEGLGLRLDREGSYRNDKRLAARPRYAKLRHQAAVEDIGYRIPRGLDRALFQRLVAGDWIDAHDNIIFCGETGLVSRFRSSLALRGALRGELRNPKGH